MRLVHRVSAAAPIGVVWALLADPRRWPEFDPLVGRVDGVTGRVRAGQHLLAIGRWLPLRVPVDVGDAEPQRRLVLTVHTAPGLREEIPSSLVETLRGRTEIRLAGRLTGRSPGWPPYRCGFVSR